MAYRRTESRIRHSEEVKNSILAAAVSLLEKEGFSALTVRKTVAAAGTSNGNFYFYFRDKEDLIDQIIRSELDRLGEFIDQAGRVTSREDDSVYAVLASMVYTGVRIGLRLVREEGVLFLPELRPRTFAGLRDFMIQRTQKVFARGVNLPPGLTPSLAAVLWQGSLLTVIDEFRDRKEAHGEIARQSAAWNLRALGTSEPDILSSLIKAEAIWSTMEESFLS